MPNRNNEKPLDDVNKIVDEIAKTEEEKNVLILSTLAKRIGKIGAMTATEAASIATMREEAAELRELLREIEIIERKQVEQAKEAIEKAATVVYNATENSLKQAAQNGNKRAIKAIAELPPIRKNEAVQAVIADTKNEAEKAFTNTYQTQAFMLRSKTNPKELVPTPLSEAYQRTINKATETIVNAPKTYQETGTAKNYTTIMRETVDDLAKSGVRVISVGEDGTETNKAAYTSQTGKQHTQRLDTAVRRNVLDYVRQVNQSVQDEVGKQIGADGVELTVHEFPAPDHAPIQGHQFATEEFDKMQTEQDFKDYQGRYYPSMQRAIGMWNCRHFVFRIILGVFSQTHTDEELQAVLDRNEEGYTLPNGKHLTMYECTQKQRRYETAIRYAKEGKITADNANDPVLTGKYKARVSELSREYRAFSEACGLKVYTDKLYVKGY